MFELVKGTQAASLYIAKEADDFAGLSHVAEKIQKDIELVTGVAPKICDAMPEGYSIIPGTIGKNPVIETKCFSIRRKTRELYYLSCGRR